MREVVEEGNFGFHFQLQFYLSSNDMKVENM